MASRMEELFRTSNDLSDFSPSTRASRHIFAFVVKQVSDDFAIEPHNKFLSDYRKRAIRCRCVRKAAHGNILSTFAKVVTEKDALNLFSSFLRDIHNLLSIKFPLVKRLLRVQGSRNRKINTAPTLQMVVVQILVRCIQPVDTPRGLLHDLI